MNVVGTCREYGVEIFWSFYMPWKLKAIRGSWRFSLPFRQDLRYATLMYLYLYPDRFLQRSRMIFSLGYHLFFTY